MSLNKNQPISTWIEDFVKSKDPKFAGKSKSERIKMATGAYYGAQKESVELDESIKKIGEFEHTHSNGDIHTTKVYKLSGEHNEGDPFTVKLFKNGKHYEPAQYFTHDEDDAKSTAQFMVKESVENLEERKYDVIGQVGGKEVKHRIRSVRDADHAKYVAKVLAGKNGLKDYQPLRAIEIHEAADTIPENRFEDHPEVKEIRGYIAAAEKEKAELQKREHDTSEVDSDINGLHDHLDEIKQKLNRRLREQNMDKVKTIINQIYNNELHESAENIQDVLATKVSAKLEQMKEEIAKKYFQLGE